MKQILAIIFCFGVLAVFWTNRYLNDHIFPNTYLDSTNISLQHRDVLLHLLAQKEQAPIKIDVHGRIYSYSLSELGIDFDLNKTVSDAFADHGSSLPQNIFNYIRALRTQRMIQPKLVFTQKFYERFQETVFDFTVKPDEVSVDPNEQQLVFTTHQEKYTIEPKTLAQQIISQFGRGATLSAQLIAVPAVGNPVTISTYNQNLRKVTANPVYISLPGISSPITLSSSDLKHLLKINYRSDQQQLTIDIDEQTLTEYIQKQVSTMLQRNDMSIDVAQLKKNLVSLATSRFNAYDTSFIQGVLVQMPQSRGDIAQKYIEIDIRQQKMYLWDGGQNVAIHRVSTGLYYPTPPGTYHIMNKATNAYSDIYHVWMPYWMAFYLDPKISAYLGIHELPYWTTGDGQQIRRPRDFIGSPHTGGCVSLDVGEAELVYNWADIGMPVVIYE